MGPCLFKDICSSLCTNTWNTWNHQTVSIDMIISDCSLRASNMPDETNHSWYFQCINLHDWFCVATAAELRKQFRYEKNTQFYCHFFVVVPFLFWPGILVWNSIFFIISQYNPLLEQKTKRLQMCLRFNKRFVFVLFSN